MANVYNRTAFHSMLASIGVPTLLRAYCGMVVLELALKDRLGLVNIGHDIPEMLHRLSSGNPSLRAALNVLRSDLTNKLAKLYATKIDGTTVRVSPQSYPNVRYLRHTSDWPNDASTDDEIEELRICVDQVRAFLKSKAGFPNPI